jgi:glucokinase
MARQDAAIGVDVGGTGTKAGIVTRAGDLLLHEEHPTDANAGTKGVLFVVDELMRRAGDVDATIGAVGVGAAGFIDAAAGAVTFAPNIVYDDPQIAAAIYSRTGLPVVVDNDANAAAWGERSFGTARGSDHLVLVTVGTGIGGGIIEGGRLVRGYTGAGAELGHVVVERDGAQCGCGLRGCIEQYASGQAIARMAREAVLDDPASSILAFAESIEAITAYDVARAARQLDPTARSVMRTAGTYLGICLSNIANLFDPETIVLGGGVIRAGEPFLGPARDTLVAMTNSQRRRPVRLDATIMGPRAGVMGAAALAFDEAKIPAAARGES